MEKIAAILIAAHFIADFVLQTDGMVRNKRQPGILAVHTAIHALTTWLLLQSWQCWQVPLSVFILHAVIDLIKQRYSKETVTTFIVDQSAHLVSLILLARLLGDFDIIKTFTGSGYQQIIAFAGFITTVRGSGFLIAIITRELIRKNNLTLQGLQNGGQLIGQLERGLIFLFFLTGQPESIGFLVAAKSILRFEESKKQKQAEYILIGTLLSFSTAIALSSVTLWAMRL
ncbi:MAG: DUF3307 domain-containing protein [Chlorobium sp.]|nr:MAG: DUF3307 domain-containing protein [Chlorobium sp.]